MCSIHEKKCIIICCESFEIRKSIPLFLETKEIFFFEMKEELTKINFYCLSVIFWNISLYEGESRNKFTLVTMDRVWVCPTHYDDSHLIGDTISETFVKTSHLSNRLPQTTRARFF